MNTAVIITGQARSFAVCARTLDWCLFRKLPNPHFFVSVADDGDADSISLLKQKYPLEFEKVNQPHVGEPDPERKLDQHAGFQRSVPIQNILRAFWHLERGYDFFKERAGDKEFEVVIRCRPDLWAQDFVLPDLTTLRTNECWTPWWGTFGGVNDRLAIMGPKAAEKYFRVFSNREALWNRGCPLHPENRQSAVLEDPDVLLVPRLLAEFRILRKPDKTSPNYHVVPEAMLPHELMAMIALR